MPASGPTHLDLAAAPGVAGVPPEGGVGLHSGVGSPRSDLAEGPTPPPAKRPNPTPSDPSAATRFALFDEGRGPSTRRSTGDGSRGPSTRRSTGDGSSNYSSARGEVLLLPFLCEKWVGGKGPLAEMHVRRGRQHQHCSGGPFGISTSGKSREGGDKTGVKNHVAESHDTLFRTRGEPPGLPRFFTGFSGIL